ncbi:ATP-binding cassette domain-containing protein [Streptomyces sp. NPDC001920]
MSPGPGLLLRSTLRTRRREFVRLSGWSLVEAVPALLSGWLVARAVDDGFLADRTAEGFGWLGLLACAVLVGAWGTRQATLRLAGVVEPFRDDLVALATTGTLRRSARLGQTVDTAGVARLTEQVEIARESYGAVVMFVQSFAVTAVSVLLGLAALDPAFLLFVVPPLVAGLVLFLLALRAMAARQRAVVLADEAIAEQVSRVAGGLRDVTACGAEDLVRRRVGARIDEAARAARALARLTALRTAALGVGGWLPLVLILAGAPWLVRGGLSAGAILGALTYVAQSLQPALRGFVQGLGGSGLWLLVTVGRILQAAGGEAAGAAGPAGGTAAGTGAGQKAGRAGGTAAGTGAGQKAGRAGGTAAGTGAGQKAGRAGGSGAARAAGEAGRAGGSGAARAAGEAGRAGGSGAARAVGEAGRAGGSGAARAAGEAGSPGAAVTVQDAGSPGTEAAGGAGSPGAAAEASGGDGRTTAAEAPGEEMGRGAAEAVGGVDAPHVVGAPGRAGGASRGAAEAVGGVDAPHVAEAPGRAGGASRGAGPRAADASRAAAVGGTYPSDGSVELRGVTFAYAPSADPVVDDLDLALPTGTHLAVVGPSGAGKSTLAALIAGVLEPRAGQVLLGGVPARSLDTGRLARSRVLIPQEAYVFAGTLHENLAYLHPTATRADLDTAVDAIGAAELVARLGGYEASLNPALLSAGERQLIALVRALLPPAPLVLLDEATCHLDPAAEALAERAFAIRPATLIVCAHRISSALRADLVLVMDGPRCRLGTHDRLLADCALYRDLIGHWDRAAQAAPDAAAGFRVLG